MIIIARKDFRRRGVKYRSRAFSRVLAGLAFIFDCNTLYLRYGESINDTQQLINIFQNAMHQYSADLLHFKALNITISWVTRDERGVAVRFT